MKYDGAHSAVSKRVIRMVGWEFDLLGLEVIVQSQIILPAAFIHRSDTQKEEKFLFFSEHLSIIVFKYFDPMLLRVFKTSHSQFVVCIVLVHQG